MLTVTTRVMVAGMVADRIVVMGLTISSGAIGGIATATSTTSVADVACAIVIGMTIDGGVAGDRHS
ncbi:MAG TPA: hypothetical protein VKB02_07875 [Pyrinomonadaceae bacterium]|nr:hypothetical protein [Pyrinomonadaceae bacterium]